MGREIKHIVIHCADTPKGVSFNANDIRDWHTSSPRNWSDIGYHFVILLNGAVEVGRDIETIGAHVKGYNSKSIGICYIGGADGEDTRTDEQKDSLLFILKYLKNKYPNAEILGHRDFPKVSKKCPCFDAKEEYKNL